MKLWPMPLIRFTPLLLALVSQPVAADEPIEVVQLHPVFAGSFSCSEHPEGQLRAMGDALGRDCLVLGPVRLDDEREFWVTHRGDGARNEDWFSWRAEVLAPFDGKVVRIHRNPTTNVPGKLKEERASMLLFERSDGVRVVQAHVREIAVKEGQTVRAGQVVARTGNNGYARTPHIHLGAWRGDTPLQIRFDLRAMAKRQEDP